jgi:ubiquinone/menaquinone biosynthesis C-methylase UbiE
MQSNEKIISCYDQVAEMYAAERSDELYNKHLDRLLLREFAAVNNDKGPLADFGCGPGQTTKFLYDNGVKDLIGIDISPAMVDAARKLSPKIKFETGDLLNISYDSNYFGSALAFYSIVHFTPDQIKTCFYEVNRVLKKEGQFLLSFHVGSEAVHFDNAYEKVVDIDLYFYKTEEIVEMLYDAGFKIIDAIERYPYKDAEYPSKRGYIWADKK